MTFGEKLKQQRESRGVHLEEIAAATKIGSRYLIALERDDFDSLPEDVFTKGFVRAVAVHIGTDPEALVEEYVRERHSRITAAAAADVDEVVREMSRVLKVGESAPKRVLFPRVSGRALAVCGGLVVLALAVWWVAARRSGEEPAVVAVAVPPSATELRSASSPSDPLPAEPDIAPETTASDLIEPDLSADSLAGTEPPAIEPEVVPPPQVEQPREEPAPPPPSARPSESVKSPPKSASVKSRPAVKPPRKSPPAKPAVVATPPQPKQSVPPPRKTSPAPAPQPKLIVSEHGIGTDVLARGLVGQSDRFREGTDVWFWTRVLRGKPGETIRHVWIYEGHEVASVALEIGSGNWSTQSRRNLQPGSIGGWAVEARDTSGRVLARQAFVCQGTN